MSARDEADFRAYLVARWPALVRTLVLLGCEHHRAEAVAEDGLARCYTAWDNVRRGDDVDTHVYRAVLERWTKIRPDEHEPPPRAPPPAASFFDAALVDPEPRIELLRGLEAALDELPQELRTVLVLRFAADLDVVQVADVLEVPVPTVEERQTKALALVDLGALWEGTR